ncbi:MAG: hypothetical protein ACKO2V_03370 [Snowella sp.]|jgi:hypothetical protein|nr:MAG: hypothetical protein DCF12_03610 [Snowella sp.]
MLTTLWATVRNGKIELLDLTELPEGTKAIVTLLPDDETDFWLQSSQTSLDTIWDNAEDEVYAQLILNS